MPSPTVSIFMLTYNQEHFIAQAIGSVLMQRTSFTYQLVIGEDCSTDRTREICKEYAAKYPEKIKLLLNERNIGLGANYVKTYAQCFGKYVAICDGDDYWIDPLKLQKQVDFLEENPDYKIIYTNNYNLLPSGRKIGPKNDDRPLTTSFSDLVMGNYIASVTSLFKRVELTGKMEKWIPHFPYADWPTYLLVLSQGGKIYFLDEPTAVYRKNFGTSTVLRNEKSTIGEINLDILKNLRRDLKFEKKKSNLQAGMNKLKIGLMASYNKEGKFLKSSLFLLKLMVYGNTLKTIAFYLYSLKGAYRMKKSQ